MEGGVEPFYMVSLMSTELRDAIGDACYAYNSNIDAKTNVDRNLDGPYYSEHNKKYGEQI